jgi:hypothetical protein
MFMQGHYYTVELVYHSAEYFADNGKFCLADDIIVWFSRLKRSPILLGRCYIYSLPMGITTCHGGFQERGRGETVGSGL